MLDNLETLLTPAGAWRDPRWEPLIAALTGHGGESRVILTSRIPPAGLAGCSAGAAGARPGPGRVRRAGPRAARPARAAARRRRAGPRSMRRRWRPTGTVVRRVLHVVQGHPKLMELADAAATTDPARLTAQLGAAETAAGGQVLDAFFRDGATTLDAAQFLDALATWTGTTLDGLPGPARLMAQFLACLEEDDRQSWIIDANWADLWRRLSQPGDPPDPAPLLAALTAAALIQPAPPPGQDQDSSAPVTYRMHPGIAQAIRATAPGVQAATDTELAVTWQQAFSLARRKEGGEAGRAIIRAGLAAAPYLLRLQDWDTAGALLEQALYRDASPATIQAALPALRAIADATQAPKDLTTLARSLASIDPAEAETLLRTALAQAAADENFTARFLRRHRPEQSAKQCGQAA